MAKKRVTRRASSTVRSLRRRLQEANDTIAPFEKGTSTRS